VWIIEVVVRMTLIRRQILTVGIENGDDEWQRDGTNKALISIKMVWYVMMTQIASSGRRLESRWLGCLTSMDRKVRRKVNEESI
jgi:hypothetical protein